MRSLLFFLFSLVFMSAAAQDLSGIWRGHFRQDNGNRMLDSLGIEERYKFETQISQTDKAFEGVTYSYQTTVFYGKATCVGTINKQTKKVLLQETKIVELKSMSGGACIMTCFLQYSKVGNEEFLEGTYTGISIQDSSFCGKGTVFLRRVENSDFYKEPFLAQQEKKRAPVSPKPSTPRKTAPPTASTPKSNAPATRSPGAPIAKKPDAAGAPATTKKSTTPAKPPVKNKPAPPTQPTLPRKSDDLKPLHEDSLKKMLGPANPSVPIPPVLSTRKNELVKTIRTSAKKLTVKIYDNGTIDNDTVSVYLDNRLVILKQRLTTQPIELQIDLNESSKVHQLIMVAENLGEIPPNTSLMIVTAGEEQYEVRITSTEQKNAMILFEYSP